MGFVRWLIVCGLLLVSAFSFGNITTADRVYYTTDRDDLLAAASDLSLPSGPTRANEPFLYFHIGPVRSDFFALSMAKTDARQFAEVADEAIKKGFGTELNVKYSKERSLLVLDSDIETSRWFLMSASRTVDFNAIREVFATKGMKPRILIRSSSFHEREGFPEKGKSRKRWVYYDGTTLGKVTVSESLGFTSWLALFFFTFWLPISLLSSIAIGLKAGRNENIPIEQRRSRYKNYVYGGMLLGIGLHLPCFMWFYGTGRFSIMSDLWTGSSSLSSLAGLLLLGSVGLMGLISRKFDKDEAQLMGTDLSAMAVEKQYQNRIKRPGFIFAMILASIGMAGFVYTIQVFRQFKPAVMILLIPVIIGLLMMGPIENHMEKKTPREPLPPTEETE